MNKDPSSFKKDVVPNKFSKQDNMRSIAILLCSIIIGLSGLLSYRPESSLFPIVIQNLFVILFSAVWGQFQGASVTGIFLLLGALGLPFFACGNSGISYLSTETGGFLAGYFIGSIVTGCYLGKPSTENKTRFPKILIGCFLGFLVIYVIGLFQYFRVNNYHLSVTTITFLSKNNIKFYFFIDIIKLLICSILAYFLRPLCAKHFYKSDIK